MKIHNHSSVRIHNHRIEKRSLNRSRRGFALVVAITLLALLALLAVGLLGLSSVTLRSSTHSEAQAEAQANARLGLMIAIDELQKSMGPDKRVSARAATLANDARVGLSLPSSTPKAWWVGVSSSDRSQGIGPSNARSVVWLVSGLDPSDSPAAQISGSFEDSVILYGDNSINTAVLTGGEPIRAGKINLPVSATGRSGSYAWFVEDEGMKAQLAASNPELSNNLPEPAGGGVLPGTYDIGILEGMDSVAGSSPDQVGRLPSINSLPLLGGASREIARSKRFSYTTRSRGVLSDVKNGGLKKDLTIAFEKDEVFNAVFGDGKDFPAKYIVMDEAKFAESPDLQKNGYIHWEMLKDYYNTKRHIITDSSGNQFLPPNVFYSQGLGWTGTADTAWGYYLNGRLGPHQIGNNPETPPLLQSFPYGDSKLSVFDYNTWSYLDDHNIVLEPLEHYKHSPVVPVLMRMQQNAWLERLDIAGEPHIRTNAQLWLAHYNPYNIWLTNNGFLSRGFSGIQFDHRGLWVERKNHLGIGSQSWLNPYFYGLLGRCQVNSSKPVSLSPGRSHVLAFQRDTDIAVENRSGYYLHGVFGDEVKDLTLEGPYYEYRLFPEQSSANTLRYIFNLRNVLTHGGSSGVPSSNRRGLNINRPSLSQILWTPYSWDGLGRKTISFENVGLEELNENTMASFSIALRTTREPVSGAGPAIRPLVDSNLRAQLGNTRWDSPLGLNVLAAYSAANENEVDEQIPQMNVQDDPKGYAYWGAGRDPVDGYDRVILFDIPRRDLVSLGQLQHANVGRFSYEPTYVIGNSYANLRIPRDQWSASVRDTLAERVGDNPANSIQGNFNLYDSSYLVNEMLWDGYTFTTISQVADNRDPDSEEQPDATHFARLRNGEASLPNPRFLPYEPAGSKFDLETLQKTTPDGEEIGGFYHNAGHLLVDGAFNVNSTSIDAWEAFLSGTHKLPWQKIDGKGEITGFETGVDGVRFPRVQASLGGPADRDSLDENYWTGFRSLQQDEVRELAAAIVEEVKKRGPFLTMSEFVNRKLDTGELGKRGALQAALDATVNKDLNSRFESNANHPGIPDHSTQGAGFPGQLLQGDILQSLAPCMTVRSDTFTIRAYGEAKSPDGSKVLARAWCEATVQRYPDPVPSPQSGKDLLSELAKPSSTFGRRFGITSFRWLDAQEI